MPDDVCNEFILFASNVLHLMPTFPRDYPYLVNKQLKTYPYLINKKSWKQSFDKDLIVSEHLFSSFIKGNSFIGMSFIEITNGIGQVKFMRTVISLKDRIPV